jgi:hypothetical protein
MWTWLKSSSGRRKKFLQNNKQKRRGKLVENERDKRRYDIMHNKYSARADKCGHIERGAQRNHSHPTPTPTPQVTTTKQSTGKFLFRRPHSFECGFLIQHLQKRIDFDCIQRRLGGFIKQGFVWWQNFCWPEPRISC